MVKVCSQHILRGNRVKAPIINERYFFAIFAQYIVDVFTYTKDFIDKIFLHGFSLLCLNRKLFRKGLRVL